MSFGGDEEILQDFLVEAGEILDQLSEQLVELERKPDDTDLLNAIFRGFHTVKGGAGFLQLEPMVECCHVTENLFDILRNGKRTVTAELMDVVLQALDTINSQFADIQQRHQPRPASPDIIAALERLVSCEDLSDEASNATAAAETPAEADAPTASGVEAGNDSPAAVPPVEADGASAGKDKSDIDLTDEEFEGFLSAIDDKDGDKAGNPVAKEPAKAENAKTSSNENDEISEEEFESLLDQLHGPGASPSAKSAGDAKPAEPSASPQKSEQASGATASKDEISEDEFESLLDQLHGVGQGPQGAAAGDAAANAGAAKEAAKPAAGASDKENDLISDDEFEDLLDQLHGQGKGPTKDSASKDAETKADSGTSKPASTANNVTPISKPPTPSSAGSGSPAPAAAPKSRAVPAAASAPTSPPPAAAASAAAAAPAAEATVRVDTQRLDDIMNMVGELVLVRNRLVRLGLDSSDESLAKAVANLDVVTADLQASVMKTRMQPIKKVFGRFPRVVRDLARNLKKEINLELVGEDTDLDKNLVEALADPLVHLVRNSVDHGIEIPSDRVDIGKPRVGKVELAAEQEGDHILLSITDDGAGMDPDKLRQKAIEKGVLDADAAARISDEEAFGLIFAPGFSTKTEISDVSGRGVGMDVVKTKITQLNGSIEIQSKLGEGTRFVIKVPLTLAIMPTLMIMLGRQTFALPLVSVNEIFHMDLTKTNVVDAQECVTIRDKAIPIFHLKRWLVKGPVSVDPPKEGHVVIVNVGTRRVGFVVDQLIGQEEVVIKPLGKMLQGTPGMAGATITGDGTIALILDVPSMLKRYAGEI